MKKDDLGLYTVVTKTTFIPENLRAICVIVESIISRISLRKGNYLLQIFFWPVNLGPVGFD